MIIKYDNKAIKYTSKWISVDSQPAPTVYQIYTSGTHGSVTASPTSGISGTEVTLSNTPDTGYAFDSYTLNGATLKNTNQFDIGNSDVYVQGNFTAIPVDYVQIGNLLWKTTNTDTYVSSGSAVIDGQRYYNPTGVSQLSSQLSDGWRVPTYNDFLALLAAVNSDGYALCAASPDWEGTEGTNTSGFTALPYGYYLSNTSSVQGLGRFAIFYSSDGYSMYTYPGYAGVEPEPINSDIYYYNVRLCKNAT